MKYLAIGGILLLGLCTQAGSAVVRLSFQGEITSIDPNYGPGVPAFAIPQGKDAQVKNPRVCALGQGGEALGQASDVEDPPNWRPWVPCPAGHQRAAAAGQQRGQQSATGSVHRRVSQLQADDQ